MAANIAIVVSFFVVLIFFIAKIASSKESVKELKTPPVPCTEGVRILSGFPIGYAVSFFRTIPLVWEFHPFSQLLPARGLYRQWGIAPRPETDFVLFFISIPFSTYHVKHLSQPGNTAISSNNGIKILLSVHFADS